METTKPQPIKTDCQLAREARDLALYNDYNKLTSVGGNSKVAVTELLMKKYSLHSPGTVYVIRRRVEERLKQEEEK